MSLTAKIGDTEFRVGDFVKVTHKFFEEGKERLQTFEGTVIAIKGKQENKMFTVRRMAIDNVGVEKIFPLASPMVIKIQVKKKGHPKRAKLYYLRKKNA